MVGTVGYPAVRGEQGPNRGLAWADSPAAAAVIHGLVAALTAAIVGGLLGQLGMTIQGGRDGSHWGYASTLVGAAVVLIALAVATGRMAVPSRSRQVPHAWRFRFRRLPLAAAYGASLGSGFTTEIPSVLTYAAYAGAFLSGSAFAGAATFAFFGIGRGLALLLASLRVVTMDDLARRAQRLWDVRRRVQRAGDVAAMTVGASLVALGTRAWT